MFSVIQIAQSLPRLLSTSTSSPPSRKQFMFPLCLSLEGTDLRVLTLISVSTSP